MYAVLDLHWTSPGAYAAYGQQPMADADHSITFWQQVAATFKADPAVIFDLFNEPFFYWIAPGGPDQWTCWLQGCTMSQPVLANGVDWSNDLSGWLTHQPSDPAGQLTAGWDSYPGQGRSPPSCWTSVVLPMAAKLPVPGTNGRTATTSSSTTGPAPDEQLRPVLPRPSGDTAVTDGTTCHTARRRWAAGSAPTLSPSDPLSAATA